MNPENKNIESGNEVVAKNPSTLITASSIHEIEALAKNAGPREVSSTILMYILENTSSLEEALTAFYLYGNQFAGILANERMYEIIKTIYMQYGKNINAMIEGVAGIEDKNAYIFNFLTEMLPSIYSSKFINMRPIDDLMKPLGLLPLLLRELHRNKREIEEMIGKFFYIRRQIPGSRQEDVTEKENATIRNFELSFQDKFEQVSQIFETSNNSAVQDRIEDIIKAMKGMSLLPGAGGIDKDTFSEGIEGVNSKVEEVQESIEEVSSKQKGDSEILRNIYTLLKSGMADSEEEDTLGLLTLQEAKEFFHSLFPGKDSEKGFQDENLQELMQVVYEKLDNIKSSEPHSIDYDEVRKIISGEINNFRSYLKPYLESEESWPASGDSFVGHDEESDAYALGADDNSDEGLEELKEFIRDTVSNEVEKIIQKIDRVAQEGAEPYEDTRDNVELSELKSKISSIEENVKTILSILEREVEESQKIRDTYLNSKSGSPAVTAKNDKKKNVDTKKNVPDNKRAPSVSNMEVDDDL